MDILESRMLLAAGIITSQSWQLPATSLPSLVSAAAARSAAVYTVPGTDRQMIVEPISVLNADVPSSSPTFAVRIISYSAGSPVELSIVSTPVNSSGAANSVAGSASSDPVSQSSPTTDPELTPEGISKLLALDWSQYAMVSGTLEPSHDWATYSIPVGPQTNSLKVHVSSAQEPESQSRPAVDQLYLVGHDGSVLASMQGVSAATASQGPQQDINIALSNVPTGAELLLRLMANPGLSTPSPTSSPSATSSPASSPTSSPTSSPSPTSATAGTTATGAGVSYKMEVQRSDPPVVIASIGGANPFGSPVSSPGNGLIVAGNLLGASSTSLASPAARASGLQPVDEWLVGKSEEGQAREAVPNRAPDQDGLTAPEISVGPLASRGSAPLGPLLGTIQGDRTHSIDRDERAFDLAMEQLGSGVGLEIALVGPQVQTASVGRESAGSQSVAPRDASGALTPLRGTGGFPVLVSSSGTTEVHIDATEMLTTLPASPRAEASADDATLVPDLTPLTLSRPEEQASDDSARTDFLTSACGLVLGIGLASRPLYPDLIGLVRTCLPRAVRPPSKGRRTWAGRIHPLRKIMSWLRPSGG